MIHWQKTKHLTKEQWLADRHLYAGSSEIAAICNADPNKSRYRVWSEKTGEARSLFTGNRFTEEGKLDEPVNLQMFQFWDYNDPCAEKLWENYRAGKKVRSVRSVTDYVTNDRFPHLRVSPDGRVIGKNEGVECKLTSSHRLKKFKDGIAREHIIQCIAALHVTEFDIWHLSYKIDHANREAFVIERNDTLFEQIVEITADFMKRVALVNEIKREFNIPTYMDAITDLMDSKQREGLAMIHDIEPDLTGDEDECEVLKETLIPTKEHTEREATEEEEATVSALVDSKVSLDTLKKENSRLSNLIKRQMGSTHDLIIGENRITYRPDINGVRKLLVTQMMP